LTFNLQGTLTPIVRNPSAALPSPQLLKALTTLAADPNNIVYIISGRDVEFLEQHLGKIKHLGLSAEHGCFIKGPEEAEWTDLTEGLDMSWKSDVEEIFKCLFFSVNHTILVELTSIYNTDYEARTTGSMVERKVSSVTFHYRNADPVYGAFQGE
jgi:trehalose 6-phosphate synthase/phosphatase